MINVFEGIQEHTIPHELYGVLICFCRASYLIKYTCNKLIYYERRGGALKISLLAQNVEVTPPPLM